MAVERLVGADASLKKATFGSALVTGNAQAGKWYKILKIDGTTVFPAGYVVGDLWQGDGVKTFSVTNSAALATFAVVADASSFSFDLSSDEIEVTVLADDVKKYRKGKTDMSGSIEGITFVSEIKKAGSIVNRFLRVVTGDSAANTPAVLNEVDGSDYYIQALLQDYDAIGETVVFLFGQIELLSYNLGAAVSDAQNYTANVRFIGADPIIYAVDQEVAAPST